MYGAALRKLHHVPSFKPTEKTNVLFNAMVTKYSAIYSQHNSSQGRITLSETFRFPVAPKAPPASHSYSHWSVEEQG